MKYPVVAVLWDDHLQVTRGDIPKNPDKLVLKPTLSVGILVKETEKCYLIVSDVEKYGDYDSGNYMIIFKSTVTGIKRFGEIKLNIKFRK
jgi:hypothetical protein